MPDATVSATSPDPQPIAGPDEAARVLAEIGALHRDIQAVTKELNDTVAAAQSVADAAAAPLVAALEAQEKRLETWATAHRAQLTNGGKTKTVTLPTGELAWKKRPDSVSIADEDALVAWLERRKLTQFLRVKTSPDKQAILKDLPQAKRMPGVTIVPGVESFNVKPLAVAAVAATA